MTRPARDPTGQGWAIAVLVGLVLLSTARSVGNGFAFDDVLIVAENSQVHQLAPPWIYATQSYWPPKNLGDAYRPWTIWWLALEWALGGGAPWVFHLVNLALTIAVTILVYRLARELVSPMAALAGAALFAVHPVHVEATANVVGQAELWMTGFAVLASWLYLRARQRPDGLGGGTRLTLAALLVLAAASKEQGIALPGLLAAIELIRFRDQSLKTRIRQLWPTYALLGIVAIGFVAGRFAVLGDLGGGPPAAGVAGVGLVGRARAMIPLAVDWVRLLVWPARLRAQYSPPEFGQSTVAMVGVGLAVLAAIGFATWRAGARAPTVALGVAWIVVAGAIVSNIPFPTGILLAERTLFLPSVGVALIASGLVDWGLPRFGPAVGVAIAVGVTLGGARSWSRQAVWRDNPTLFTQTVIDARGGYRSFYVRGKDYQHRGLLDSAAVAYERSAALWDSDARVFEEWGQVLRTEHRCPAAVPVLERGLAADSTSTLSRSRLIECLIELGRYDDARARAEEGLALGLTEFKGSLARIAAKADPSASTK